MAFIRAHNYAETAAELAGISAPTYYRWMKRGESSARGAYREFRDAVKAAERLAEAAAVESVRASIRGGDWKAAMTWLERKFPDRWARRARIEHTGKDGGPIAAAVTTTVDLSKLSVEELQQLEALLARAESHPTPDTP